LLFISKDDYYPIPDEFKIWYGDEWLWEYNLKKGTNPRILLNYKIASKVETTSKANIEQIKVVKFNDHQLVKEKSIRDRVRGL
jgi:hypothetical protein